MLILTRSPTASALDDVGKSDRTLDLADLGVDLRVRRAVMTSMDRCGEKPYTAAPRPATTEAISANLRAGQRAGALRRRMELGKIDGRSVMC